MSDRKYVLTVPSGVGDWSWIWSKLHAVEGQIAKWQIVDGMPRRTSSYVELACPGIPVEYAGISYAQVRGFQVMNDLDGKPWREVGELEAAGICLDANSHLEAGKPLADWLPDLPTSYHYPLHTSKRDKDRAAWLLEEHALAQHPMSSGPTLLFNGASHKGATAWNAWDIDTWVALLRRCMKQGWRPVAIGGYWDDLTFAVCCELGLPSLVGKTNTAQWVELLRLGDACINYSSGINVVRTVLEKPVLALWPHHQNDLRASWAPPHMIESEEYLSSLWLPLQEVWPLVMRHLSIVEKTLGGRVDRAYDQPLE